MDKGSEETLKKQKKVFIAIVGVFVVVTLFMAYKLTEGDIYRSETQPKASISLPSDKIDPQEVWLSRLEEGNKVLSDKVSFMEQLILDQKNQEAVRERENANLKRELSRLKQELQSKGEESHISTESIHIQSPFQENVADFQNNMRSNNLKEVSLGNFKREKVQHVDQVIPAGTSVRAILVSSVDAPCGVFANSDPYPIKLRILGDTVLPNNLRVKLKGGLVIASAYGDLSSERVYVRVERMTQPKPNGEFVETDITGFVSGEDGKYGIRGVVADKSGKLIESAAFSGFFSGLSQYLQATVNTQNLSQATMGLPNDAKWDVLKNSGLQGVTNSMDKITEYYVKRAEQLQPVIQIEAGRVVDITFTYGAEMGDLHTKDKVKKIRDANGEV